MIHLPVLSEYDPTEIGEGSIDPLGLYATADLLAVALIPGVRERQSKPRFLTATAVSLAVCRDFDEDRVAIDGISPPWQVFEWYLVEGLVRTAQVSGQNKGLPGQQKVSRAIQDKVPLSARRYLKNPRTFGFHGIYRVLAKTLNIEEAGLGMFGYELLEAWADEQALNGFLGASSGFGSECRMQLVKAVEDGLTKGHVARSASWGGWNFFRDHLSLTVAGPRESEMLTGALTGPETRHLREIWDFLLSDTGRMLCKAEATEREIHTEMQATCTGELQHLLGTILQYETFSRLLQDAFDDCLHHMSQNAIRTRAVDLAGIGSIKLAIERIPTLYNELMERLEQHQAIVHFQDNFFALSEPLSEIDWVTRLLDHHMQVQRRKPPDGKAPWFDQFDDGSYTIRQAYRNDEGGRHNDDYVHMYRCNPLLNFAIDLGHLD